VHLHAPLRHVRAHRHAHIRYVRVTTLEPAAMMNDK
jgi:hypothetical protein